MSSDGTKVTTDPETFNNPKDENPGVVTSDSLGAESIEEGGSFAANADARGPMKQPSQSTTTNTEDVSSATRLDPAPDAEARLVTEEWSESAVLNAGLGEGKEAGRGPTWDIRSGGQSAGQSAGQSGGQSGGVSDATNQQTAVSDPGPAHEHVSTLTPTMTEGEAKPKGKDIQEGGFDPDLPNASYNTDIGGKDDPGRAALGKFEEENVPFAGGAGPREGKVSNDGKYDVLEDTSA